MMDTEYIPFERLIPNRDQNKHKSIHKYRLELNCVREGDRAR